MECCVEYKYLVLKILSFIAHQYPARFSNSQPDFYNTAKEDSEERQEPLGEFIYID